LFVAQNVADHMHLRQHPLLVILIRNHVFWVWGVTPHGDNRVGNQARPFLQKEWTGVAIQVARSRRCRGQHRVEASSHGDNRVGNQARLFLQKSGRVAWYGRLDMVVVAGYSV
jgi:hypothetical protein